MPLTMKKIIINKTGSNAGSASIALEDELGMSLVLNKIQIDMNAADAPVKVLNHEGTQLFAGDLIDQMKDLLFNIFSSQLSEQNPGMYEVTKDGIKQLM